jgi:hypothetical protein
MDLDITSFEEKLVSLKDFVFSGINVACHNEKRRMDIKIDKLIGETGNKYRCRQVRVLGNNFELYHSLFGNS